MRICGFIEAISDPTPGIGIIFLVYSYQFYKVKKAKKDYIKQDIL